MKRLGLVIGGVWAGMLAIALRWFHIRKQRDRAEEEAFKEREEGRR
jgi:hypothetical protein